MIQNSGKAPQRSQPSYWTLSKEKPVLAIIVACLLLVTYIGFLVVSNYQSHVALREAALNRFRLDLEKRAASLGYFFSERKYDLNALVLSIEINTYFANKALGMSEQYGLKVNLFMVQQLLKKMVDERHVQGDKIYSRFVFLDNSGQSLIDTSTKLGSSIPVDRPSIPKPMDRLPHVYIIDDEDKHQVLFSAACSHKNRIVGELIVWLAEETLFTHFIDLADVNSLTGAGLIDDQGRMQRPYAVSDQDFAAHLPLERISALPRTGFSFHSYRFEGETHEILVAILPIHNLDLNYIAWMPSEQIAGGVPPRYLIFGMVILAAFILAALGLILWFSAQNLILKTRFDEAAKQQDKLAIKNRQLKAEIQKREKAEHELESQRALRMRSDRLRSLGEMAAGIAHELNQPLVGVRGFAELMIDSLDDGMELAPDEIRRYTETIVQQADRMVHIINHVRLFARDAGSVETTVVDLNEVVRSGLSLLTAQFQSHGLLLEIEFAAHPLPVSVNSFSVEEVILNLLSNARHSVEHREAVEGDTYQPCVRVITRNQINDRGEAVVVVEDNGTGIPAHVADKIFDPFFTTKDPDKGTGLGLSICKSIVESFQGKIHFVTTENQGTRFEIMFPKCTHQEM